MIKNKTGPKDVFLHLLAIIMLYVSAISFLTLVYQIINISFPDPLEAGRFISSGINGAIRWSISSLVIVFPVYLLSSWYLNKSYEQAPVKRELRIRKWLIYFTLFVAALIIIGDLVTLINTFLGGGLTLRFILKVLAVLFVAGSVFWYYLWDLRKHKTE